MSSISDTGLSGGALLSELRRVAVREGRNETGWPGLSVFRADEPATRIPVVYDPCVCIVGHGSKQVDLAGQRYVYDPMNDLVVGVPLPVEAEISTASSADPFLSLQLSLDPSILAELVANVAPEAPAADDAQSGIYASRMTQDLAGAVIRLFRSVRSHDDRTVLAPLAVREVIYHVLMGEQGEKLRGVAASDSRANRIHKVLVFMHQNFSAAMSIETLAEQSFMSPSAFHHNFKAVSGMTPLRYLKMIRLHRARSLMLQDGTLAGDAADAVGYNSQSQFTREFRRLFGASPLAEVRRIRLGQDRADVVDSRSPGG